LFHNQALHTYAHSKTDVELVWQSDYANGMRRLLFILFHCKQCGNTKGVLRPYLFTVHLDEL